MFRIVQRFQPFVIPLTVSLVGGVSGIYSFSDGSSSSSTAGSGSSGKCPVDFLWKWSGNKTLPVGHPPLKTGETAEEQPAVFNTNHFPKGVNANFLETDAKGAAEKFAGPNGLFEGEGRQIAKYSSNVIQTLRLYGLREGGCVGDVGAGTGVIMRLLSQAVGPTGTVLAGDISPAFIQLLNDQLLKDSRLKNVSVIQGTNKNINFPVDKKCDLIVVCDVYHHFEYPRTTCRQIRGALKPQGKLVVIDFHKDESKIKTMPKGWVTDHLRGTQEDFRKEIESAGFRLVASPEIEGLTDNYCMVFEPL